MRYSLLNYLARPQSSDELVCITVKEVEQSLPHCRLLDCFRVSPPGGLVGPLPSSFNGRTAMGTVLARHSQPPADPERNQSVEVEAGLLVCPNTGRWYPIRGFIPELLPDHLRDLAADFEFLRSLETHLPSDLFQLLNNPALFDQSAAEDSGFRYKSSEIHITDKVDDPGMFGPGYISPFNPGATEHTVYLIRLFAFCLSLIQSEPGKVVLDTGSGYSWTTEWLLKSGYEAIGLDIARVYMDIGRQRAAAMTPYMLIGDTENLPIRSDSIDVVLGYDSFHHIPDRPAAMRQFDRVLKQEGRVILGEPDGAHESAPGSQAVMDKYGILERGMELADVLSYVQGTGLTQVEQIFPLRAARSELNSMLTLEFTRTHNWSAANLFRIARTAQPVPATPVSALDVKTAWGLFVSAVKGRISSRQ